MTRAELVAAFRKRILTHDVLKVRHKNMRTVEFYVMGEEESVHQKLMGWWICLQTGEPIVQETITIKKEDLKNWEII